MVHKYHSPAVPSNSDSDIPDEPAKKARVQDLWEDDKEFDKDFDEDEQAEAELRESIEAAERMLLVSP